MLPTAPKVGGANWLCGCSEDVAPALWLVAALSAPASISIACSSGLLLVELVLSAVLELAEDEVVVDAGAVVSVTVELSG